MTRPIADPPTPSRDPAVPASPLPDTVDAAATSGDPPGAARRLLRTATAPAHAALEANPVMAALATDPGRATLAEALWRQAGWYAAMEPAIEAALGDAAPADLAARRKRPLLERDLTALGLDPAAVPVCRAIPRLDGPAAALGAAYVLEGATLGGAILSRRLAAALGPGAPGRFFDPYGAERGARWRAFLAHLEHHLDRPARRRAAADAAVRTFDSLACWLDDADARRCA
jgi:heme oxygenase